MYLADRATRDPDEGADLMMTWRRLAEAFVGGLGLRDDRSELLAWRLVMTALRRALWGLVEDHRALLRHQPANSEMLPDAIEPILAETGLRAKGRDRFGHPVRYWKDHLCDDPLHPGPKRSRRFIADAPGVRSRRLSVGVVFRVRSRCNRPGVAAPPAP